MLVPRNFLVSIGYFPICRGGRLSGLPPQSRATFMPDFNSSNSLDYMRKSEIETIGKGINPQSAGVFARDFAERRLMMRVIMRA